MRICGQDVTRDLITLSHQRPEKGFQFFIPNVSAKYAKASIAVKYFFFSLQTLISEDLFTLLK